VAIDAGGLTVGQRLDRIEADLKEILRRFEVFATDAEVKELKGRVDHVYDAGSRQAQDAYIKAERLEVRLDKVEKSYLPRGTFWGLIAFICVQFLAIIGLALGLLYEILNHK
jgi:hypothetical protein